MILTLLTKQELSLKNKRTLKYDLMTAEKDYFKVRVMDIREICSEKIRAMSDRMRYRDFYDYCLITQHYPLNFSEIYELMRQKETRKIISKASILQNWELAKEAKQKERSVVYYQDALFAHDEQIQQAVETLSFEPIPINSVFQK